MKTLWKACLIVVAAQLAACGGGGGGTPPTGPGNTPPVARFTASPTSGSPPMTVQFDASSSSDADGTVTTYAWDFGDGSTGSGVVVSHEYTQPGVLTVRLTITDNAGGQATTTTLIDLSQPSGGVWLGEYESSLIEVAPLYAEVDVAGTAISGTWEDNTGRRGTLSGSVNGTAVTLQMVSTTPGCAGTFTGGGSMEINLVPGTEAIVFTFTGNDCNGDHADGAGVLVLQRSTVVAWGQVDPTGLTHRDGELYWTDRSLAPLKKHVLATGETTPLSSRMIGITSLAVGTDFILWTDGTGDRGTSGCTGSGLFRSLMIADSDGTNSRELTTGDFCGNSTPPSGALVDDTHAYWVVADSGTPGRIERVPLAGGEPEILASPGNGFNGMAIDATHIYWSESSIAEYSNILRCPIAGCGGQPPETILTTGEEFTIWRGLELAGDQLVFGSRRTGEPMYEISILPKDGGTPTKIADSPGQVLRILTDGSDVFWLDSNDVLSSVPVGGGAATVVVPDFFYVRDIALGPDRVYWVDASVQGGFPDGVYYAARSGGPVSKLVDGNSPFRLAVEASGNVVYADGDDGGFGPAGISRVSPAGVVLDSFSGLSGPSLVAVDNQNVYAVQGFSIKSVDRLGGSANLVTKTNFYVEAMVTDGTSVYWLEDPQGIVFKVPSDGSAAPISLGFNNRKAFDLELSGDYAYWLGGGDTLSRAPIAGGGPVETIADDLAFATSFVVDDTHIYVIESDAGSVTRMTLTGGDRTSIGSSGLNFGWFAMTQDVDNIYWAKAGSLNRVSKDGSEHQDYPGMVSVDQFALEWIAVDDQFLYWTEEVFGAIKRVPK